jgi:hypothetical protein
MHPWFYYVPQGNIRLFSPQHFCNIVDKINGNKDPAVKPVCEATSSHIVLCWNNCRNTKGRYYLMNIIFFLLILNLPHGRYERRREPNSPPQGEPEDQYNKLVTHHEVFLSHSIDPAQASWNIHDFDVL